MSHLSRTCRPSSPRPSTSCARSPPSARSPCCCSAAARTRSSSCTWPRRRSAPARFPFPLMHVDTGHNFAEVIEFRDRMVERARRAPDRRLGAGVDRRGPRRRGDRPARVAQPPADGDAARRDRRARLRRRVRRRAPRRGARPRQGAHPQLPRRLRRLGPQEPAPRAVEPLQRADPPRRERPRLPAVATGPSSTSGSTSSRRRSRCPSIYLAHEREVFRRDGMLYATQRVRRARRARRGAVPRRASATARSATCRCTGAVASTRRDARRRRRRDRRDRASPSAARPAPTTASPRPRWRTARLPATSSVPHDHRCCASPPRAPSTTASRR